MTLKGHFEINWPLTVLLSILFNKLPCIKSRNLNAESTANQEKKSMSEYGGKTANLTKIVRWN